MTYLRLRSLAVLVILGLPAAARADETTDRVDRLFARWDGPDSPGGALGVVKDGRLVYEKAVGKADVEQDRSINSETVFHIASLSKQFTAMAVLLLEKDGKLSLDDDVRKHLPELHDFGKTITIRHLLLHTSGLRDQWDLVTLAGWRMSDVITDDDVFRLACRQRELNFEPGTRHLYCNTGYTLAARIVERAAGQPFRDFARSRIFEPLGMAHTRFPADHEEIVPRRARSYHPAGDGRYENSILSYGTVGATSLLTTVADLARWDANFDEPRVGDAAILEKLQAGGTLNDGRKIDYALGLVNGTYRGRKVVEHAGSDAGFRCTLLRFPTERFSVILLANTSDAAPGELARRVADVYLEGELDPVPAKPAAAETKGGAGHPPGRRVADPGFTAEQAEACVGDFYSGELGVIYTVFRRGDRLMLRHPRAELELRPVSPGVFEAPRPLGKVTTRRGPDGRVTTLLIETGRVLRLRFERVEHALPE